MFAAFRLRGAARFILVMAVTSGALVLSQAPSNAGVPNDIPTVINQPIQQALTELADKAPGVEVVVDPPLGNVDPAPVVVIDEEGTQSNFDGGTSQVTLTPGVAVPNLQDLTPQAAEDSLAALGLTRNVVSGDPSAQGVTVVAQDPAPETIVPLQTAVAVSLSAAIVPTQPVQTQSQTDSGDHPPWVWVLIGLVLVAIAITATSLWRRSRRRTRTEAAQEQVLVRARGPAPATSRIEPLDAVPALSIWLDPHRDDGDQILEEVRQ